MEESWTMEQALAYLVNSLCIEQAISPVSSKHISPSKLVDLREKELAWRHNEEAHKNRIISREVDDLRQQRDNLLAALQLIAKDGCENYWGDTNCWNNGRILGAEDGADAVCNSCIAANAIASVEGKDNE